MSEQVVFTKEEVAEIKEALRTGARHAENNCCEKDTIEIDTALDILNSPRPKVTIPLSIVYEIMLTRWDSIEEGEALIKRSLSLSGIEVVDD